jgi:phosphate transport system permease protein
MQEGGIMLPTHLQVLQRRRRRYSDQIAPIGLLMCALVTIFTTIGIVFTLFFDSFSFFRQVSFIDFLFGTKWSPLIAPFAYGVLPLLLGTLMITVIGCIVAIPIGLAAAIFLSEYAPSPLRRIVKPILEVLAGVPTIVYGFFALFFVTPLLQSLFPTLGLFNALSAGIVVGIMIIPIVASLSEDAMRAVPNALRDGAYALGATKLEVSLRVVLPAALSGVISSFVLAGSRAIGETMIVTVAAGATPRLTTDPFDSIQTMTAYIVQVSLGDTPYGSIAYGSIFAIGLTLFVITFILNMIALYVARRFREVY